ncbi:MAG TPA: RsmE family RNA methyltransferase [Bryobacteraceae bacterium]|nr:RsmE family RNA methyltransferase [Bryobacteraceae bacterium]
MARRRFFVDSVHNGQARIAGPDAHHLTRVLRVEPGQKFELSDNQNVYLAEVETARKDLVSFAILERVETPRPPLRSALLVALIKFERFEWIIEKATELGVERLVPLETERTDNGLAAAAGKRLARWRRIAREASEQSRRSHLPEIDAPLHLAGALAFSADVRLVLEEQAATPVLYHLPTERRREDCVALITGPEGGWTDRERSAIATAGWKPVSLGPEILRAETAAIAGLATLNAAWFVGR